MKADLFYTSAGGRTLFKGLQAMGGFRLAARALHTRASRCLIPGYIKKHGIDMRPYAGQNYDSFADFFARARPSVTVPAGPEVLISPCDSLLSVYPVSEALAIPMKGSVYTLSDLLPDREIAALYEDGLCLVFRLEASDYHHFCCFDDGQLLKTAAIPGQLHSVQPIAHSHVPVFRLNRRWWSVLETKHFGRVVQIEVGAVLIGGVSFFIGEGPFRRGEEMGCFELAGSTILLLLDASVRRQLRLAPALSLSEGEVRVQMGDRLGLLMAQD